MVEACLRRPMDFGAQLPPCLLLLLRLLLSLFPVLLCFYSHLAPPRCNLGLQRERPGNPSLRGQGWHNQFMDPLYETPYKLNSMYLFRYSAVAETFLLSTFLRFHSTRRFNSNTPRASYTANLRRWEIT